MNKYIFKTNRFLLFGSTMVLLSCQKPVKPVEEAPKDKSVISLSSTQAKILGLDSVKLENEQTELALTGKVAFDEDKVAKVYPLASGNVMKVNVSLGDYVKKGDVLAVLRSGEINDYQNQYDVAISNSQIAKKNLDIAEELFKTKVNSEKDVLNARNDYKKSVSEVNKIKQLLSIYGANAENNDALYRIIAPTDGYIVEKNINENMQVRGDNASSIFTVSFLNEVWVLADVYESDLAKLNIGDDALITTIAYPDKVFKGKVLKLGTLLDPITKTLKLRIVLDNKDALLKPEMFASLKIHSKVQNKVLTIPTKSLVFDNSHFTVMVARNDTAFERRNVEVIRSVGDKTFISTGLKAGERVVTDGSLLTSFSGF